MSRMDFPILRRRKCRVSIKILHSHAPNKNVHISLDAHALRTEPFMMAYFNYDRYSF